MSKKMKAVDSAAGDLQRRADDATAELQSSRTEIQRLITELQRVKASSDETQARQDAANRENKQLAGSFVASIINSIVVVNM